MHLHWLYLKQFRNYQESYFEFSPSINIIYGLNATGKTTILEAIYLLMIGRSFRSSSQVDLIKESEDFFYVESLFCKHNVDQKLRILLAKKEKKIQHNQTLLSSYSNLLGFIQGVVLTPDDINLIKGPPARRRQFLDIQLSQIDPLYVHYLMRYQRAMKHRNQLLKEKNSQTLEIWEEEMSQAASYLVLKRKQAISSLQDLCRMIYKELTNQYEELELIYRSSMNDEMNPEELQKYYRQQFQINRKREWGLGQTLIGPHKDDLSLMIEKKDVRYFASEGQQRCCVTALYLAEWKRLKSATDSLPILMIDDIGLNLDEKRRERLISQLSSLGQIFLTTTDKQFLSFPERETKIFNTPI